MTLIKNFPPHWDLISLQKEIDAYVQTPEIATPHTAYTPITVISKDPSGLLITSTTPERQPSYHLQIFFAVMIFPACFAVWFFTRNEPLVSITVTVGILLICGLMFTPQNDAYQVAVLQNANVKRFLRKRIKEMNG